MQWQGSEGLKFYRLHVGGTFVLTFPLRLKVMAPQLLFRKIDPIPKDGPIHEIQQRVSQRASNDPIHPTSFVSFSLRDLYTRYTLAVRVAVSTLIWRPIILSELH